MWWKRVEEGGGLRSEEEAGADLADGFVKGGFLAAKAADEEAEPEAEKHGGEDRTKNRGLDDLDVVDPIVPRASDEDHEEDDFHEGTQAGRGGCQQSSPPQGGGGGK